MPSTTSLKLPEDLKERISKLAQGVAQTPHAYMVEAIAEKVARDEKRRSLVEDARRSRDEVDKSGTVFAHGDVMRWFRARAAGKSAPKPRASRVKRPR